LAGPNKKDPKARQNRVKSERSTWGQTIILHIHLTKGAGFGRVELMPRQLRVEFPGAIYHVMSRGDRKRAIYLDDVDRQDFLKTLAEACQKTGFEVHAYCLMRNHFHLVVETPNANLVAGMRWLLSSYTIRLNHREKGMEARRRERSDGSEWKPVEQGWCLGSEIEACNGRQPGGRLGSTLAYFLLDDYLHFLYDSCIQSFKISGAPHESYLPPFPHRPGPSRRLPGSRNHR
jgi:REP element-mobilizing transposase RayT